MSVPVRRYKRHKLLSDPTSPELYYLKLEAGGYKTFDIESIAREIETVGALSAEDVTHTMKAFVRQLRKTLIEGNKVKVDGLGTFHITFNTIGVAAEKDCTVKNIRKVNIRFLADPTLRLTNDSTATTRGGDNNVKFYIKGEGSEGGNTGGNEGGGGVIDPGA